MKSRDQYIIFVLVLTLTIFTPSTVVNSLIILQCYSPQIYVDSENTVHATWSLSEESEDFTARKRYLQYTKKTANSTNWSEIKTLYTPTAITYQDAEFTVDKEENLHLVWGENIKDNRVYYRYWNASKKKWNPIETISDFEEPCSGGPRILVDAEFNVHVVWAHYGNYSGEGYEANFLYRCKNATHGTWQSIEILTFENSTGNPYDSSIAIDNNNNIAVAWIDEGRVNYKLRYNNNGTWTNSTKISGSHCQNPIIKCDSANNLHFTWMESNWPYNREIHYAKYERDTDQFFQEEIFSGPFTSCPVMVLDQYGNIHIAWESGINNDVDIYYCVKNNSSVTFDKVSKESTSHSNYPSISVGTNNIVHFLWCDLTQYNGADMYYDIFYKSKNLTSGVWSSTTVLSLSFKSDKLGERLILLLLCFSSIVLVESIGFIIIRKRSNRNLI